MEVILYPDTFNISTIEGNGKNIPTPKGTIANCKLVICYWKNEVQWIEIIDNGISICIYEGFSKQPELFDLVCSKIALLDLPNFE